MQSEIKPTSIQDKYEVHGLIGTGGQANVYKGIEKLTEREVAIKVIKIEDVNSDLEREIELLVKMRSPFIISFIEALKYETEIWVVMEYCACGSMKDIYALQRHGLNEDQVKDVVSFAVLGLHHIHNLRCLHRDVKAANLLLSGDGVAKLADFGVSAELDEGASTRHSTVGSAHWMSPEMINGVGYDGSADIWSLGITIIELVEGNPPNIKHNPRRSITMTVTNPAPKLRNSNLWSADMKDFVDRCLQKDPKHRANTRELLQHRWINQTVQTLVINRGSILLKELFVTVNNLKLKLMEDYENSLLTPEQREAKAQAKIAAEEARLKAINDAEEAIRLKAIAEAEAEAARLKAISDEEEAARLRLIAEAEEIERLKAQAEAEEAARLKAIADAEAEAEIARLKAIAEAEEVARLKAIAEAEEQARLKALAEAEAETARLRAIAEAEAEEEKRLKAIADAEEAERLMALAEAEEAARLKAIAEAEEQARLKAIAEAEAEEARLKLITEKKEAARLKAINEAKEIARLKAIAEAEAEYIRLKSLAEAEEVTRLASQGVEISEIQSHIDHLEADLIQSNEERNRLKDLIESANERYLLAESNHKKLSQHMEETRKDYDCKTDLLFDFLAEQQILQNKLTEEEAVEFHNNERKNSSVLIESLPIENPKPLKYEGFLLKKGKSLGMWQKRPYVIDNGVLMYISKNVVKHRYAFSASTIFLHSNTDSNNNSNNNIPLCGIYLADERAGWTVSLKCENDESKLKWVEVIQNHLSYVLSIVNSQTLRENLQKLAEKQQIEEKKKEEYHEHVLVNLRKQVHDSEVRRILIENEIAQLSSDLEKSLHELNLSETNIVQSKILLSQLSQSYEKVQFDCERIPHEILNEKQHLDEVKQNYQKVNEEAKIANESIVLKEISLSDIQINEDLIVIDDNFDLIGSSLLSSSSSTTITLSTQLTETATSILTRKLRSISQPPLKSFDDDELNLLPERKVKLRLSQSEVTYNEELDLDLLPPPPLKLQTSQSEIKVNSSSNLTNRQRKGISQEFKSLMAEKLSQKRELMRLKLFANEAGLLVNKMEEKVRNIVEEKDNLGKQNELEISSSSSSSSLTLQDQDKDQDKEKVQQKDEISLVNNIPFEQQPQQLEKDNDNQEGKQTLESNENIHNNNENISNDKNFDTNNDIIESIPTPENILMISQQSEDDDDYFNDSQDQYQDDNEKLQLQPQFQLQLQLQSSQSSNNSITEASILEQEVEKLNQLKVEIEKAATLIENIEKLSLESSENDSISLSSSDKLSEGGNTRPVSLRSNRSSSSRLSVKQEQEIYEARMTKIAQDEADKWEIATYETLDALRLPSISSGTTAVVNGQLRQSVDLRSTSLIGNSLSGPLRHVGWLYKQSEYLQSWNKRYFVLENCVLSYYYNTHSIGHTYEITPKTRLVTVIPSQPLCLKIDDPVGNWNLMIKCENETSKQEWIWRLQEHIKYVTNPPTNNITKNLDILAEEDEDEEDLRRTLENDEESNRSSIPPAPTISTSTSISSSPKKKRSIPSIPQSDVMTLTQFGTQKGWGSKQGTFIWNARYFILSNATLTYFASDSPSDLETPRGTYIFTPSTKLITPSMDSSLPSNSLCLQDTPGEWSITIKFENEEIVEQWHRSISIHLMFISES